MSSEAEQPGKVEGLPTKTNLLKMFHAIFQPPCYGSYTQHLDHLGDTQIIHILV